MCGCKRPAARHGAIADQAGVVRVRGAVGVAAVIDEAEPGAECVAACAVGVAAVRRAGQLVITGESLAGAAEGVAVAAIVGGAAICVVALGPCSSRGPPGLASAGGADVAGRVGFARAVVVAGATDETRAASGGVLAGAIADAGVVRAGQTIVTGVGLTGALRPVAAVVLGAAEIVVAGRHDVRVGWLLGRRRQRRAASQAGLVGFACTGRPTLAFDITRWSSVVCAGP